MLSFPESARNMTRYNYVSTCMNEYKCVYLKDKKRSCSDGGQPRGVRTESLGQTFEPKIACGLPKSQVQTAS